MSESQPQVVEGEEGQPTEEELRLYTPLEVTLASLLGGPLAAAALLAGNQKRIKQKKSARTLMLGFAGMLIYIFLLWWVPTSSLRGVIVVVQTIVMYAAAGIASSRTLKALDLDELPESPPAWHAAVMGIAGLAVVITGTILLDRATHWQTSDTGMRRIMISPKEDVIYWGKNHQSQAKNIGQALLDEGFFNGKNNRTALLALDDKGEYVLSLIAGPDFINNPKMDAQLNKIGQSVKPVVGNGAVVVRALDAGFTEKKHIEIQ